MVASAKREQLIVSLLPDQKETAHNQLCSVPSGKFEAVPTPPARSNQMTLCGETFLSHEPMIAVTAEPSLASKIAFLSRPDSYGDPARTVSRRETHMSWVFLAGDRVFKLKKPVCFPYLDFSTLARREAACRAELRLNRRLAAMSTWVLCHWFGRRAASRLAVQGLRLTGSSSCAGSTRP